LNSVTGIDRQPNQNYKFPNGVFVERKHQAALARFAGAGIAKRFWGKQ
jgi:hypothetical protein